MSTPNKHCLHINRHNIEIVNNYTYLGINFSSNGNFKVYKSNLKDKVRRSFFATRRYLDFSKIPSDTTKLINFLIHFFYPFSSMVHRYEVSMTKMISQTGKKILLNILLLEYYRIICKKSLGVNKQCQNFAPRNELGRLPLKLTIDIMHQPIQKNTIKNTNTKNTIQKQRFENLRICNFFAIFSHLQLFLQTLLFLCNLKLI